MQNKWISVICTQALTCHKRMLCPNQFCRNHEKNVERERRPLYTQTILTNILAAKRAEIST